MLYKSRIALNKVKKEEYTLGVHPHKAERARKQQITLLEKAKKKKAIPFELQLPIRDPSKDTTKERLRETANERILALTGQLGLFESTRNPQEPQRAARAKEYRRDWFPSIQ
jgi:flagellar biogenesis protein FliO